ncbi:MAG: ABC transporter substrate-binding protein [Actinobacteria bacterium]|nr:ABC transporter substrate-binding protein [Actinomycetota bacterium]
MAVLCAGCGGASKGGASTQTGAGATVTPSLPAATKDVDHITWALPYGEPPTIDPTLGSNYSPSLVTSNLCDSLVRENPDFSFSPNLARWSWPTPTTLVYTLRHGVRFWDGNEMTSDDVVYSLKRGMRPESYVAVYFDNVASIAATGRYEVTVRFKQPDELFNKEMSNTAGSVIEKAFAQRAGKRLGSARGGIMCSGPFKLTAWKAGDEIELTRNDRYWNPAYRAHARTVTLRFLADSSALAQALLAGEVDGAYEVPSAVAPRLSSASNGTLYYGRSTQFADVNVMRPDGPLADTNLRRALFGVIDRDGIAQAVYHGGATPNYTLVSTNTWDADAKSVFAAAYPPFVKANKLTASAAKALVDASPAKGKTLTLAVLDGDATQSQIAQLVQEEARSIGITVKIQALQATQYADATVDPRARQGIDLAVAVGWNNVADPLEPMQFYVRAGSPYNYTNYDNPSVNALLARARQTADPKARAKLLVQAQAIFEPAYIGATVVNKQEALFLNKRLTGATTSITYLFEPSLAKLGAAG